MNVDVWGCVLGLLFNVRGGFEAKPKKNGPLNRFNVYQQFYYEQTLARSVNNDIPAYTMPSILPHTSLLVRFECDCGIVGSDNLAAWRGGSARRGR